MSILVEINFTIESKEPMKGLLVALLLIVFVKSGAQGQITLKTIVNELAAGEQIESELIGANAMPSAQHHLYEKLVAIADDETLLSLTFHTSPNVQYFAAKGLTDKNADLFLKALHQLEGDTSEITNQNGCIVNRTKLNEALTNLAYYKFIHKKKKITISAKEKSFIEERYHYFQKQSLDRYKSERN